MNEITEALTAAKRVRMIAAALELLQHERIDSAVIPIPGTAPQRYVTIGTATTVARLLEIDQVGTHAGSLAGDSRFRQMMQEYAMGDATVEQVAARLEEWHVGRLPSAGTEKED